LESEFILFIKSLSISLFQFFKKKGLQIFWLLCSFKKKKYQFFENSYQINSAKEV